VGLKHVKRRLENPDVIFTHAEQLRLVFTAPDGNPT